MRTSRSATIKVVERPVWYATALEICEKSLFISYLRGISSLRHYKYFCCRLVAALHRRIEIMADAGFSRTRQRPREVRHRHLPSSAGTRTASAGQRAAAVLSPLVNRALKRTVLSMLVGPPRFSTTNDRT